LHNFKGIPDGEYPYAGLINVNGTLYGTTYFGGAYDDGTVFSITASGKVTVLHSFGMTGDGEYPIAGLIDVGATLYGTTPAGGANDGGTVFALSP
ncbi:MAG: choice-of-anchor tandem repeat GloVer-containing protein, partial [Candidatus Cybelea sp.]